MSEREIKETPESRIRRAMAAPATQELEEVREHDYETIAMVVLLLIVVVGAFFLIALSMGLITGDVIDAVNEASQPDRP